MICSAHDSLQFGRPSLNALMATAPTGTFFCNLPHLSCLALNRWYVIYTYGNIIMYVCMYIHVYVHIYIHRYMIYVSRTIQSSWYMYFVRAFCSQSWLMIFLAPHLLYVEVNDALSIVSSRSLLPFCSRVVQCFSSRVWIPWCSKRVILGHLPGEHRMHFTKLLVWRQSNKSHTRVPRFFPRWPV